jgi:5'-phosphate synthase pdxT subunit
MTVGILALQGDFREHEQILQRAGVPTQQVRLPAQLDAVDRLIIPGGESTAIGRLLVRFELLEPIRRRAGRDLALWGTCAGAILMARTISEGRPEGQPHLGVMDIAVRRNAFGRQLDSFEADLSIAALGDEPLHAVFIRAPLIERVGAGAHALARLDDGGIVAAQQGRLLATAFHPELTGDDRMHRYFLEL